MPHSPRVSSKCSRSSPKDSATPTLRTASLSRRRTVDHHVSAILRKLDADSRGEAVADAQRLGLLEHVDRLSQG